MNTENPVPGWRGFTAPRYTQIPDEFFDLWLAHLTGPEVKVMLYIMRRTFGWKKDRDAISVKQICSGIARRDGSAVDLGTGLARSTVIVAVQRLVALGLLDAERQATADRGDMATIYRPRMNPLSDFPHDPGPRIGRGGVRESATQETTLQQTKNARARSSRDGKSDNGTDETADTSSTNAFAKALQPATDPESPEVADGWLNDLLG